MLLVAAPFVDHTIMCTHCAEHLTKDISYYLHTQNFPGGGGRLRQARQHAQVAHLISSRAGYLTQVNNFKL